MRKTKTWLVNLLKGIALLKILHTFVPLIDNQYIVL